MAFELTKPFNKYFDHTLLKPDASESDIIKLVSEAVQYDFAAVCVNGSNVKLVLDLLHKSAAAVSEGSCSHGVKIAAVVGFPLGASTPAAKVFETKCAIEDGAEEIDMVINIGAAKDSRWNCVEDEIRRIARVCHGSSDEAEDGCRSDRRILKVIIETCLLTDEEIEKACLVSQQAGADFVKTSTGFSTGGATVEDVVLMKKTAGPSVMVKASGGIRTLSDAKAMIEAGADRLGCSASVQIMKDYLAQIHYSQSADMS